MPPITKFVGSIAAAILLALAGGPATGAGFQLPDTSEYEPGGSEWGCGVLLCLAGLKPPSECSGYLNRLWRVMNAIPPGPFPTCTIAGASNYAKKSNEPYDLCPAGHAPARRGQVVAQGVPTGETKPFRPKYLLQGNYAPSEPASDDGSAPGQRACVRGYVGQYDTCDNCGLGGDAGGGTPTTVNVYSSVVWLPYKGPRAIDVIIDGAIYNRVHY